MEAASDGGAPVRSWRLELAGPGGVVRFVFIFLAAVVPALGWMRLWEELYQTRVVPPGFTARGAYYMQQTAPRHHTSLALALDRFLLGAVPPLVLALGLLLWELGKVQLVSLVLLRARRLRVVGGDDELLTTRDNDGAQVRICHAKLRHPDARLPAYRGLVWARVAGRAPSAGPYRQADEGLAHVTAFETEPQRHARASRRRATLVECLALALLLVAATSPYLICLAGGGAGFLLSH